ncbi:MAG: hypothetical protein GY751_18160 [Bacteroidetes bacterium]|nr:hypothetical protein [Bacteroidota bacterium]
MSRKRGKLSNGEMEYIRQNCFDLSLEEIAIHLNRTIQPIKKYIDQQNLKARDLTDSEHLLSTLRTRYYFFELKKQMSDGEITFFEHQWIDFFKQFNEDVTHTEEMQILEVIRTEILINRSMEDRQAIMEQIEQLNEMIDAELEKDSDMQDTNALALFQTQLGSLIGSKSSYINEHEKLLTKKERYLKDLKGTREQRKRVADDAKTNFSMWMRELDSIEAKEREGFEMVVQAKAADKARGRLAELHEYEDGEVDQPLLNSDTVQGIEDA